MHFYLHFLTLILQCHLEKRHRVIICHFLNINFHNAAEKERKCCILISLAPYFPPLRGNTCLPWPAQAGKGGKSSVIPHPPVIPHPSVIPCLTRNLDSRFHGNDRKMHGNDRKMHGNDTLSLLFRTLLSFRPRVRHGVTLLDTESGVWIPAPDQVEGMLSRE